MPYRVVIQPAAARQIRKSDQAVRRRVLTKIEALANDPRPAGVEKLAGHEDRYRVRVGNYRIVYSIHDDQLLVLVVAVGDRKDVYR